MEENGGMEFCSASVQHLSGKRLRKRLLPDGEPPRCEICGESMSSCGCRGGAALYEPDTDSWVCGKCFEIFKDLLTLTAD